MSNHTPISMGDTEKKHVSGALKFMASEEHRAQALKAAESWKQRFAEEPKWKKVVGGMRRFANEDHLREKSSRPPQPDTEAASPQRTLSIKSGKWLSANVAGRRLQPDNPLSIDIAAASTARARAASSAGTPLTSTPGHNAFASGGFWESLTPQAPSETTLPPTPITAILPVSWAPSIPTDPDARAVYDIVKKDAAAAALRISAARLGLNPTLSDEKDGLHSSMVTPKDDLRAAQRTLASRQLVLKQHLPRSLLDTVSTIHAEQIVNLGEHVIPDIGALHNIDTWLAIDEVTLEPTTIFDTALECLRTARYRREASELELGAPALQLAWAVKLLEDAEVRFEKWADEASTVETAEDEEESGYDYSNFLRSTKHWHAGGSEYDEGSVDEWGRTRGSSIATSTNYASSIRSTTSAYSSSPYCRSPSPPPPIPNFTRPFGRSETSLAPSLTPNLIHSQSDLLPSSRPRGPSQTNSDRPSLAHSQSDLPSRSRGPSQTSSDRPTRTSRSRGPSTSSADRPNLLRRIISHPSKMANMLSTPDPPPLPSLLGTMVPASPPPISSSPPPPRPRRHTRGTGTILSSRAETESPSLHAMDKGARRIGPSFSELTQWAEELRGLGGDAEEEEEEGEESSYTDVDGGDREGGWEAERARDDEEGDDVVTPTALSDMPFPMAFHERRAHIDERDSHRCEQRALGSEQRTQSVSQFAHRREQRTGCDAQHAHRGIRRSCSEVAAEVYWTGELRRMENREMERQEEEREIFLQAEARRGRRGVRE